MTIDFVVMDSKKYPQPKYPAQEVCMNCHHPYKEHFSNGDACPDGQDTFRQRFGVPTGEKTDDATLCATCDRPYGMHYFDNCDSPASDRKFEPFKRHMGIEEHNAQRFSKLFVGLPTDAAQRKSIPVYSGFVRYFPDAMAAVAELSRIGNDQHNPGKPLHWDRSKSGDELDAATRHMLEAGTVDTDGVRHSTKLAWRAMANLQKELERERDV